eukprot:scaffold306_cov241-Pinguiococcus_pyrenoidosus.AAC.1
MGRTPRELDVEDLGVGGSRLGNKLLCIDTLHSDPAGMLHSAEDGAEWHMRASREAVRSSPIHFVLFLQFAFMQLSSARFSSVQLTAQRCFASV